MSTVLDFALAYADLGLRVHPIYGVYERDGVVRCTCWRWPECKAGKHPVLTEWQHRATSDPAVIQGWWDDGDLRPEHNLAVATGNGLLVVDVDLHNPEIDGPDQWFRFCLQHGIFSGRTPIQHTPSGGRHYLFKTDTEVKSIDGWLPSVDSKSEGGYVLVSPSRHVNGGMYRWQDDTLDLEHSLQAPPVLVETINGSSGSRRGGGIDGGTAGGREGDLPSTGFLMQHGLRAGSRDSDCYRLACRLWSQGDPESVVLGKVREAWKHRAPGQPDFGWDDAMSKIHYARNFVERSREFETGAAI